LDHHLFHIGILGISEQRVDFLTSFIHLIFQMNKMGLKNWDKFSRSSKRGILEWILNAKKSETRKKRINETITLAEKNIKANHPQ
jgi:hypothetical protein